VKRRIGIGEAAALKCGWLSKQLIFVLVCLGACSSCFARAGVNEQTRIYTREVSTDSLMLVFDNQYPVPVTTKLTLELENLEGDLMSAFTAIVPAKASGYVLARFRKTDWRKAYRCSFTWKIVLGDVSQVPDLNYRYQYPFQKGKHYHVSQGPGGLISHKDSYAYDFVMPVGTPLVAARDGIVIAIKSDSSVGGPYSMYADQANFVSIYHADGTIANYFHLKKGGVAVKEGQEVKQGELIGYSGSTGFSSGPHLHFEVVRPGADFESNQSVAFSWDNTSRSRSLSATSRRGLFQTKIFGKTGSDR
jgi:murein DD-endopeptidase MepM/ murein hydrolase activator NlpD